MIRCILFSAASACLPFALDDCLFGYARLAMQFLVRQMLVICICFVSHACFSQLVLLSVVQRQ